jgi:hypothetical protein
MRAYTCSSTASTTTAQSTFGKYEPVSSRWLKSASNDRQHDREDEATEHNDKPTCRVGGLPQPATKSVTLEQVLKQLGYCDVLLGFGPQRRGLCPLYDEPEERFRSFSVNLAKNLFQCFHPSCRATDYVLDLWAAAHLASRLWKLPVIWPIPSTCHCRRTQHWNQRNPYPNACNPLTPNVLLSTSR